MVEAVVAIRIKMEITMKKVMSIEVVAVEAAEALEEIAVDVVVVEAVVAEVAMIDPLEKESPLI